jgi:RHS repeat-associated protein
VRKIVEEYDGGSWSETLDRKYVWYNWLLLAELDGEDDSVIKKYTWGPDLAGQHGQPGSLESAGGIGGLLATRDEVLGKSYAHFYDGNGNTGQLILRADGSTAAAYEYDAYGNVTAQTGSYADDNAWRFSTKQWDDETGLGYWGERYYDSGDGRWVNRDSIGEKGGTNLHAFLTNRPTSMIDPLGHTACTDGCGNPPANNCVGEGEAWCECIRGCRLRNCGGFMDCLTDTLGYLGYQVIECAVGCAASAKLGVPPHYVAGCVAACLPATAVSDIPLVMMCMRLASDCKDSANMAFQFCIDRY